MVLSGIRLRCLAVALVSAAIGAGLASFAWAHGDSPPFQAPEVPTPHPVAIAFFIALLIPLSSVLSRRLLQCRLHSPWPLAGTRMTWVVVGLLSLYLIVLPPHLVHHIGDPQSSDPPCTLLIQGTVTDQGSVEHSILLAEPVFAGEASSRFTASVPTHSVPLLRDRSPPEPSA
jgi:hypothetical protein